MVQWIHMDQVATTDQRLDDPSINIDFTPKIEELREMLLTLSTLKGNLHMAQRKTVDDEIENAKIALNSHISTMARTYVEQLRVLPDERRRADFTAALMQLFQKGADPNHPSEGMRKTMNPADEALFNRAVTEAWVAITKDLEHRSRMSEVIKRVEELQTANTSEFAR